MFLTRTEQKADPPIPFARRNKHMASNEAPDIVVGRLPIYLRALTFMALDGREITSSQELSEKLGISSAQIRKDLSHFGEFGKQGTGYEISYLRDQLKRILRVESTWPVALVGCGDLGHALANYGGFAPKGFEIVAVFDNDLDKIGQKVAGKQVEALGKLPLIVREQNIKVAIVAVPSSAAQEVADMLVESGIKAILNYAPINISVPSDVRVQYMDPVAHLQHMTYYVK
jgi:redox-sensing transcriptional repressor